MKDHLTKAITTGVRVYAAITTDLVNEGIRRHDCYPIAAAALGRTMTGALLLAANMKNQEALTIRFAGDGPLGSVVADATPEGFVRGYVQHPHVDLPLNVQGKLDVGGGIGQGLLSVTRFTGLKEPVTGSTEILTGEIGDDLTKYLYDSEQTPSSVGLGVLVGTDKENESFKTLAAGGFIIQPMPDADDEVIDRLEENLRVMKPVSSLINDGMDTKDIIAELLKGFDRIDYLTTTDLAFKCQCSKERISGVLSSLGEADLKKLIEDGSAEVVCHFCGDKHRFSLEELQEILNHAQNK